MAFVAGRPLSAAGSEAARVPIWARVIPSVVLEVASLHRCIFLHLFEHALVSKVNDGLWDLG